MGAALSATPYQCHCASKKDPLDVPGQDACATDPSETLVLFPNQIQRPSLTDTTKRSSLDAGASTGTTPSFPSDESNRGSLEVLKSVSERNVEGDEDMDTSVTTDSGPIILEMGHQSSVGEDTDMSDIQSVKSFGESVVSEMLSGRGDDKDGNESAISDDELGPSRRRGMKTMVMDRDSSVKRSQVVKRQVSADMQQNIRLCYNIQGKAYHSCGAMGQVQKAVGKVTGAVRVVKTLPINAKDNDKEAAKMERHISIVGTFDHPNLMMLHEIFEDAKHLYLLLDYCRGGTLADRFAAKVAGTCVSSEVQGSLIMRQVLRAVSYMHENKICHRDLGPHNVLFPSVAPTRPIDTKTLVKVAALRSPCSIAKRETMTAVRGSIGYMAPEVVAKLYTKACDLWSCGAILFELLFGRVPALAGEDVLDPRKQPKSNKFVSKGGHAHSAAAVKVVGSGTDGVNNTAEDVAFAAKAATVTDDGRGICANLLMDDAKARATAYQALQHKWLKKGTSKLRYPAIRIDVIEQLKSYRNLNRFKQAALRLMATILSEQETAESRKLFLSLDLDGDGMLSMAEFQERIKADPKLCKDYSDEVIKRLFEDVDAKGGNLHKNFSYMEFLAATFDRQKSLTDAILRVCFDCFDKNGDGKISIAELAIGHHLGHMSMEEIGVILNDLDENDDNEIDFEEFTNMMREQINVPARTEPVW